MGTATRTWTPSQRYGRGCSSRSSASGTWSAAASRRPEAAIPTGQPATTCPAALVTPTRRSDATVEPSAGGGESLRPPRHPEADVLRTLAIGIGIALLVFALT